MTNLVPIWTSTSWLEIQLMLAAFLLCSLIGIERQFHLKAAGYRTHVLVGLGSCGFTIISGWGFTAVLGPEVGLDPSRIASQVVTGIGFLGAGVIFKGRTVVRGLTTAASVWVAAAVGMACGAGMISLGIIVTVFHLTTLFLVAPLMRRMPTQDRRKTLQVTYADGEGILRDLLEAATRHGFASRILRSIRRGRGANAEIIIRIRFDGKRSVDTLVPVFAELPGISRVELIRDHGRDSNEDADDDEF